MSCNSKLPHDGVAVDCGTEDELTFAVPGGDVGGDDGVCVGGDSEHGSTASNSSGHRDLAAAREAKLEEMEAEKRALAHNETKAVNILRLVVFAVLSIATTIVSMGVKRYIQNDQREDFQSDFDANAEKLFESFHSSIERKLEACDTLATTYTSFAMYTQSEFPFVTLPDFATRGANIRILSDASAVTYYPVVSDLNRAEWEQYSINHWDWLDKEILIEQDQLDQQDVRFHKTMGKRHLVQGNNSTEMLEGDQNEDLVVTDAFGRPLRYHIENLNAMDGSTGPAPLGSGPYLPGWQLSPVIPVKSSLNFNLLSHPSAGGAASTVLRTGQAVMDVADNLDQQHLGLSGAWFKLILDNSQWRNEVDGYLSDPVSHLVYPVFDALDPSTRHVAGVLVSSIYWRVTFQSLLPPNARGIICVLSNTRNQTLSYRIDGDEPTYLGSGDWHDPKYDHMVRSADMATYIARTARIDTRSYTSVDLNDQYSAYSLRVYPSSDTENEFVNDDPLLFTLIVIGIFCFSSFVFIAYDAIVARRQRIVMERALASSAIVSSLFPSQVRAKMYQETQDQQRAAKEVTTGLDAWKVEQQQQAPEPTKRGNLANLFTDTTVTFADISGFTGWSSTRTPDQVFELLEALYSAFDKIAERRGVFKVETIGDCYVAVTGLPEPQEDHACRMVKFARDIMTKMVHITRDLSVSLGGDTINLKLRVGLHSGSVTAGVLRGQKARFQLFGDTVNTASRMESNGQAGRIHVSQATADALIVAGKESWLTAREDLVLAKGKGKMQTYWITVHQAPYSNTTNNSSSDLRMLDDGENDSVVEDQ